MKIRVLARYIIFDNALENARRESPRCPFSCLGHTLISRLAASPPYFNMPPPSKRLRARTGGVPATQDLEAITHIGNAPDGSRQTSRVRSVSACEKCRARKTKCDNQRPECGYCKKIGAVCVYVDDANVPL